MYYSHKFLFLYVSIFLFCLSSIIPANAAIIVPPIIAVSVNGATSGGTFYNSQLGPSKFDYTATLNDIAGTSSSGTHDYLINGAVYTNCGANGNCNGNGSVAVEVIPFKLTLLNGTDNVSMNITGQVGNKVLSSGKATDFKFKRTNTIPAAPWQADLQLFGDLDQTTISTRTKPGDYSGVFTIQMTVP